MENRAERKEVEHERRHYYGDTVRKCLVFAGFVTLWAILRDAELLQLYSMIGILAILIITVIAGLTSPMNRMIIAASNGISAVLFILFEYFAVMRYFETQTFWNEVFLLRKILAITFLIALYLSTKTLREMRRD